MEADFGEPYEAWDLSVATARPREGALDWAEVFFLPGPFCRAMKNKWNR